MENKEILKNQIKEILKKEADKFPFIAQLWEMEIYEKNKNDINDNMIHFGHFETKAHTSNRFYKPFSKIIDFSKLDE